QLLDDRAPARLVVRKHRLQVARLRLQRLGERQRVLERQPRPRADGVVGRVQGIADQYVVAIGPAAVRDPRKRAPDRSVGDETVTVESGGEHLLANSAAL